MSSKSVKLFNAMAVLSSLMLVSATSNGLSNTFQVYAEDNCDTTSTCTNTPGSDTQRNNCNRTSTCSNVASGNSNNQNNNCERSLCLTQAIGNLNSQNLNCRSAFCSNAAINDLNTQNLNCRAADSCLNGGVFNAGENNQNLACTNTVECVNLHPSNPNNQNGMSIYG